MQRKGLAPTVIGHLRSSSCDGWLTRVVNANRQRSPDQKRLKQSQQWEVCLRKCRAVKSLAFRTRGLVAEGLDQMSHCSTGLDIQELQSRWAIAQNMTRARQENRYASLDAASDKRKRGRQLRSGSGASNRSSSCDSSGSDVSAGVMRGASSSDESAAEEAGRMLGTAARVISSRATSDFGNLAAGAKDQRQPVQVSSSLAQLKVQPSSDKEQAAKFALYEAYTAEVETMRNTIMKLHEESRPLLPEALAASMKHQICSIDSEEAMAIPEETVEWFVYHMMHKAEQNNLSMARMLDSFEKKLTFLAGSCQNECPVCLETFDEATRRPETLGCCHKVCIECWTRWTTMMHGLEKHPFCPCCHHERFLDTINVEEDSAMRIHNFTEGPLGDIDLSDSGSDAVGERTCFLPAPFSCSVGTRMQRKSRQR